ncbi:Protoporphyrinogen oxidase [Xylariaceae sp. FL0594]|nr:Protoporphyrinogen oxidase [Xylariaceae sp. FL0594]
MIAMISQLPEDVFVNALRSVYRNTQHSIRRRPRIVPGLSATRCLSTAPRLHNYYITRQSGGPGGYVSSKTFATTSEAHKKREIAVIGAGITGLTAAHYLARHARDAHITIYEASDRPGGWIKADRVEVEDEQGQKGHVLFQRGPRMLRSYKGSTKWDDLVLYDVLCNLDMTDKLQHPKGVSSARYLYYPDHLVKLPAPEDLKSTEGIFKLAKSLITEPLWSGWARSLYNYIQFSKLPPGALGDKQYYEKTGMLRDESVADFVTKLTGDPRLVENILSGMMHGIYGGDVHKLSAKQTLLEEKWLDANYPVPAQQKAGSNGGQKGKKSSRRGWQDEWYLIGDMLMGPNRLKIIELAEKALGWDLLAFEDGLISLVRGLVRDLQKRNNVTFKMNTTVTSLEHKDNKILVTTPESAKPVEHDYVICTLFSRQLARIAKPAGSLPSLAETHAVTIMVVNLWYPNPDLLYRRTEGGFGYLIPQSTPDNDACVLGVLFDSDLRTENDDKDNKAAGEMPGTKLTVMLGGHYWDGWKHLPTEEMGIAMAKDAVSRQLGIGADEKVVASARLCRECLPQQYVGHRERMRDAHMELLETFKGRLTVAGPSYTGVGVLPAMRAGFETGMRVVKSLNTAKGKSKGHPYYKPVADLATGEFYLDWWGLAKRYTNDPEPRDLVGDTGLKRFTHREGNRIVLRDGDRMPFRTFTNISFRFVDNEGKFLNIEERDAENSPFEKEEGNGADNKSGKANLREDDRE